jgi:hypothetical protein
MRPRAHTTQPTPSRGGPDAPCQRCLGGANIGGPVFDYNHSAAYVTDVLGLAATYGQTQAQTVGSGTAGRVVVDWALAQVGTPYAWGGERPASASTVLALFKPPTKQLVSPFLG